MHGSIGMLKLGISVGMVRALFGVTVTLQTGVQITKVLGHFLVADRMASPDQLPGQRAEVLARPAERRLWGTAAQRFHQLFQQSRQLGIIDFQAASAPAAAEDSLSSQGGGAQFADPLFPQFSSGSP